MKRGHNFDMDSWRLAANITAHHGNVYAETYRYNYGPVWFELLHVLDRIAQWLPNPYHAFRLMIVSVLTLADLGIWYLLKRRFGLVAGFLFFLNPISIIITGYHNQFDTLAILAALAAVVVYGEHDGPLTRRTWWGLGLLGVSLTIKHLFFAFPLWLAVRQKGWRAKALVLVVPTGIFLLSFVPWLIGGEHGIAQNVFGYGSFNNAPFWYVLVPQAVQTIISFKLLFFGSLIIFAFIMRKRPVTEALLIYTLVLVVFSQAIANQYLAIVCAVIAVYPNVFFLLYAFFATLLLALSPAGLHSDKLVHLLPAPLRDSLSNSFRAYDIPIVLLALGMLWQFQRDVFIRPVRRALRWIRREATFQWESR